MKNVLFFLICINQILFGDIPEPYRSIDDLPFDGHGWFSNHAPLESLIASKSPKKVIEIGSWLGASTRFIGSILPKGAVLYAVDTWKGSQAEAVHQQDARLSYLYHLFLSNVKHAGLTDVIIPVRMESLEAAKALNIKADLIYLDASHETADVINDIMHWFPHLSPEGVMCGDDWTWESVRTAVIDCASRLKMKIHAEGNFWRYE